MMTVTSASRDWPDYSMMAVSMPSRLDLSVLIPVDDEDADLTPLVARLHDLLNTLQLRHEVLTLTTRPDGYGPALAHGFAHAAGEFILTIETDVRAQATVRELWQARTRADIIVATSGSASASATRGLLRRALNRFVRRGLSLPVGDMFSR